MGLQTCVSLLESLELSDVVQVVPSDHDGSVHFVGDHQTLVQLASDGGQTSEWAFVVNVVSVDGGLWGLKTYT